MNKNELLSVISYKAGVSKKDAGAVLDALTLTIRDVLKDGEKLSLAGFGTFDIRENSARTGRNPQTGESIQIEASRSVKFKASKQLKDYIN